MDKLLSLGADPNIINNNGNSALSKAFTSENIPAIKMLLKRNINKGVSKCVESLAKSNTPIISEISNFLNRNLKGDKDKIIESLRPTIEFGNIPLLKILESLLKDMP